MSLQGPGASVKAIKGSAAKGMILPFVPMPLTFHKICYYVPFPKVSTISDSTCQGTSVKLNYQGCCSSHVATCSDLQRIPWSVHLGSEM